MQNRMNVPCHSPADGAAAEALGDLPVWNLDDLYPAPDAPALKEDIAWLTKECADFAGAYQGKMDTLDAAGLLGAIDRYEKITTVSGRIGSYAGLRFHQDMSDPERVKFLSDMQTALTDATTHLVFFTLELNRIEDSALDGMIAENADLARYQPVLRRLRAMRPHQLSDELETYLHDKSVVGSSAWVKLFDETMARIRFDVDGEELGLEATLDRLSEQDRARREGAVRALIDGFGKELPLFSRITNTLAKEKEISDRWRKFESPQSSRHLSNDVEPEVVEALRNAVVAAYPKLSHRYYKLKAKWMGLEKLQVWDRNAPLPEKDERVVPWSEARRIVEEAYGAFDPKMADLAKPFFDKGWIDAGVTEGKAPGAFAHPTVTDAHPYVLLNYLGKVRDVMTLAHELGHGVHQVLAADQGELLSSTPLTLAETASVFGEMLTFRRLLDDAKDKRARKILLAEKVEDMINTVVRQIAFYDFECKLHAARAEGELTPEGIGEIWMSVQGESLGPVFEFVEGYDTFWAYIPHFIHSPFYVYAYAFGDGLVNALYAVYESGEPGFQERYFEMLKAGGAKHHSELLAPFGLDASDPAFWDKGLSLIASMIDELEELDG